MDVNFRNMLTDDFEVTRKILVPDGMGGYTSSWVLVDTYKGRLDDETGNERMRGKQDVDYVKERLFLYPNTGILRNDRVEGIGRLFRVVYLRTEFEEHPLEVLCEEIIKNEVVT